MKRNQIIIATAGTISAIAFGYFGVQMFGRNIMYGASAGVFGLGAGAGVAQVVVGRGRTVTVLDN
ncbi:hypothetical protein IQ276_038765 [Desmonostoc muscorum LEGE 12446]|uniref:Uncharacterized protein n=1 Tax=Desmonostoc muscorum LEGE 12446 TaxID=1828758 RepID=A0A8J7DBJ5_DESMC|nr:hypothetical protein [Desmonostoc muscorum]MCF2152230.1 hypothetical protein [Desmonostoc muscorum LEGE 12446]